MIRVGVLGAGGRMGATVCRAVIDDDRFELVAAIDPGADGQPLSSVVDGEVPNLVIAAEIDHLAEKQVDAIVDFTVASSAVENLTWCAENGIHAVCGTTGIGALAIENLKALFGAADGPNCIIAPNFAISAVLMMRFAELAAPYFDGVEIVELHHNQKKDAPSGTAIETARRIAAARGSDSFAPDPTTEEVRAGARGGAEGDIHIHSVRLPGLVAHQEVIFGALGQALRLHQDSFDRASFMPGVLLALSKVSTTPGLTIGLDALLGF